MKFPTAKERRDIKFKRNPTTTFKNIVKSFVYHNILTKVLSTYANSVVVPIPIEAYANKDRFLELCKQLIPSDYKVFITHDGGGMYDVLYVGWEENGQ